MKQVDLPSEAEVGLELALTIHAGVRATQMEAEAAVAHRIVFEAKAFKINLFTWKDILVEGFLAVVVRVGQLGLVEIVTGLGEDNPFLPDIDADTKNGGDVLSEELLLFKRGAVEDVEIHLHAVELQFVAQRNVVDELALFVFNHVHGIGRLENTEIAIPHEVVGVDTLHGRVDEWRVAHLQEEVVFAGVVLVVERHAHLVAADLVPKFGAVIDVNGVGVVLPAANGHNLLACRKEEVVGEVPVEVSPVSALEEGVGEIDVRCVDALAKVVGELLPKGAVQGHNEVFARKAVFRIGLDGVIAEVVVDGEVGTGVQLKVVQSDERLLVLRKALQASEKA